MTSGRDSSKRCAAPAKDIYKCRESCGAADMLGLKTIPLALQHAVLHLLFFVSIFMNTACIFMILLLHLDVPPFMVCAPGLGLPSTSRLDKGKGPKSDEDGSNNGGRDKAKDKGSARGEDRSNSQDRDDDEDEDPDSDDPSDKNSQDNESGKKTFDFYFQNNRARTSEARGTIKYLLSEIKEIEARDSGASSGILKARESKLKDLRADLEEECVRYTTQTKYYQAGNFNTMPMSWWAKSGKEEKWHHSGGYYYHPDKHRQFVQAVQAVQMLDDKNDAFFEIYETECAKWYASWSLYCAANERGKINTWRQESYNKVPDTNNLEDTTMVLTRLTSDFLPALDSDASAQKPRSKKNKNKNKRAGGSSAASASQQRVPKDAASAEDANAASQAVNRQPRKQPSGHQKREKAKAKLAAAARASLDAGAEDGAAGGGSEDEGAKDASAEQANKDAEAEQANKDAQAEQANKDAQAEQAKKKAQDERAKKDNDFTAQRAALRVVRGVGGSSSQHVGVHDQHVVTSGLATHQLDETLVRMAAGSNAIVLTANSDADGDEDEGASSASAVSKKRPRTATKVESEGQK